MQWGVSDQRNPTGFCTLSIPTDKSYHFDRGCRMRNEIPHTAYPFLSLVSEKYPGNPSVFALPAWKSADLPFPVYLAF